MVLILTLEEKERLRRLIIQKIKTYKGVLSIERQRRLKVYQLILQKISDKD